jgi:hypothetical protein
MGNSISCVREALFSGVNAACKILLAGYGSVSSGILMAVSAVLWMQLSSEGRT